MRRVRFKIPYSAEDLKKIEADDNYSPDTRAMAYPSKYPHWCSGSGDGYDIYVAFAPDEDAVGYIKNLWPEFEGEFDFNEPVEKIENSGRFPIDYEIYDIDGVARYPGKTAAEKAAEKKAITEGLAAAVEKQKKLPEGMIVHEEGGVTIFASASDPKAVAQALHDLHTKMGDNLSD